MDVKGCELCFPLQSPGSPRDGSPPKNGEKLQNSPRSPRSNPRKWGKITEKLQKIYFRRFFCNISVILSHVRGLDRGGEFCIFSPFLGDFRPEGFRGSVRGNTTRKSRDARTDWQNANTRCHGWPQPASQRGTLHCDLPMGPGRRPRNRKAIKVTVSMAQNDFSGPYPKRLLGLLFAFYLARHSNLASQH